jgi:hypothetical protein
LNQEEAINRFSELISSAEQLNNHIDDQNLIQWKLNTEVAIDKIFGRDTRNMRKFKGIRWIPSNLSFDKNVRQQEYYKCDQNGLQTSIILLKSFIDEIKDFGLESSTNETVESSAIEKVKLIINRFHQVVRQLQARHSNRNTLEIGDEYDVQDLFHALLKLYFDDIRPEEYTPSYAGSASRVDFFVKR